MAPDERKDLPMSIMTPVDIMRLQREVNAIDDFLIQANVRSSGTPVQAPRTTKSLDELSREMNLNLLVEADRKNLQNFLGATLQQAPVVHISFAVDPSGLVLQKILEWFRKEIHPLVLFRVGVQPSIAAGCIVRTSNKYFDLSLGKHLQKNQQLLLDRIFGGRSAS